MNANPYLMLGVRPFINCCSVRTMHGGSLMLPQVREAMAEASRHFVNLDELMEAAGRRLAELTGANGDRHLRQRRRGRARDGSVRRRQRSGEDAAPAVHRRNGKPGHHPEYPAFRLRPGGADDRVPSGRDRDPRGSRCGARRAGCNGRAARQTRAPRELAARGDRRDRQTPRYPDYGRRGLRASRAAEPVAHPRRRSRRLQRRQIFARPADQRAVAGLETTGAGGLVQCFTAPGTGPPDESIEGGHHRCFDRSRALVRGARPRSRAAAMVR